MGLSNNLKQRACPICQSSDKSNIMFKNNLDESKLNNLAYSSRKIPEFMNFELVCCPVCDILYAPDIPANEYLQNAYEHTGYESNTEAGYAAKSYAVELGKVLTSLPDLDSALEVGTGNGAFLQYLIDLGFK